MIQVLLFASLREQAGTSSLEFEPRTQPATVATLIEELSAASEALARALATDNLLCAVNQQQVSRDHGIAAGDEVAFFPPVTGG